MAKIGGQNMWKAMLIII